MGEGAQEAEPRGVPAWEKVAFQAGPCHCQLWDSTDGSFQASFSSL